MKQRVGIARALVRGPELLCMDEPFGSLDVLTAEALRSEVTKLWQRPDTGLKSILLITHLIEEAVFLGDRIVVFAANPGHVHKVIRNELPHPREYADKAFLRKVDEVHQVVTRLHLPDEPTPAPVSAPAPDRPAPLPAVGMTQVTGLLEIVADKGGDMDVFALDALTDYEFGHTIAVVKAGELLDLLETPKNRVLLTPLGRAYVAGDPNARKRLLHGQLLELPTFRFVLGLLDRASEKRLPAAAVRGATRGEAAADGADRPALPDDRRVGPLRRALRLQRDGRGDLPRRRGPGGRRAAGRGQGLMVFVRARRRPSPGRTRRRARGRPAGERLGGRHGPRALGRAPREPRRRGPAVGARRSARRSSSTSPSGRSPGTRCSRSRAALVAYLFSLLFTIVYGTVAAHSRRAERVMIPVLDVLQGIPVLSFVPGLVLGLMALFPHSNVGPRARVRPRDLHGPGVEHDVLLPRLAARDPEASSPRSRGSTASAGGSVCSTLEIPSAMIGLVWNSMMSMAGGWFFLTVVEAFTARRSRRTGCRGSAPTWRWRSRPATGARWRAAALAMVVMIVLVDQLLWRPAHRLGGAVQARGDGCRRKAAPRSCTTSSAARASSRASAPGCAARATPGRASRRTARRGRTALLRRVLARAVAVVAGALVVWGGWHLAFLLLGLGPDDWLPHRARARLQRLARPRRGRARRALGGARRHRGSAARRAPPASSSR